jgi:hypothetical protein
MAAVDMSAATNRARTKFFFMGFLMLMGAPVISAALCPLGYRVPV